MSRSGHSVALCPDSTVLYVCSSPAPSFAKGMHTAVEAVDHLLRRGCDPMLWIAGDVLDSQYQHLLQRMASDRGIDTRVAWLGPRDDIPQLMVRSSAVVLPSLSEGLPRVLLEAMALGVPVVATPVGGIQDIILPGVTGLFAEAEDPVSLADGLEFIATHRAKAQDMASQARQLVSTQHTVSDHTSRYFALLKEAASVAPR